MHDLPLLFAYLGAATLLTITPGLDTAMVLRAASVDGARTAALTAIGIGIGCLAWGGAVSLGLGAVLTTSELAYALLKWAGAAYLVWLGAKLILQPRDSIAVVGDSSTAGDSMALRRGFLTNMLNPKVGVFYLTFLPQFIPAGASVARYSFFLAAIHVALGLAWFAMLISATAPLSQILKKPAVTKMLDRVTGALFIAFGIRLAVSTVNR